MFIQQTFLVELRKLDQAQLISKIIQKVYKYSDINLYSISIELWIFIVMELWINKNVLILNLHGNFRITMLKYYFFARYENIISNKI